MKHAGKDISLYFGGTMSDVLDTPRTDEMVFQCPRSQAFGSPVTVQLAWATLSRQLERENADLRKQLDEAEIVIRRFVYDPNLKDASTWLSNATTKPE